ncbi:hypothetical protein E2986_12263, partial [Frieseomelitta varia]
FARKWYFIAGTSTNLSSCGRLLVKKATSTEFLIKFRTHRHKSNIFPVSDMAGKVDGNNIVTYWLRSKRKLGPFYHVVISAKYDTTIGMLVCTGTKGVHGKQVGHDLVPREELAFADLGGTEIQTGGVR